MSDKSAEFVGDIPKHYDTGLGPNIFTDYGDRLAATCAALEPQFVLELAAGTGIVSRRLRNALPGSTSLEVTDLNGPMLDIARTKFSPDEDVTFSEANAMALPYDDAAFDLITCQFGVMFFPDKPGSYREAARVLRPGGHYVFNVWGLMSENPFSQMAHDVCAGAFPDDPPGFYKVPFHYGDPNDVLSDLKAGGWQDVQHKTIKLEKQIVDSDAFATALVFGNPLYDEIISRGGSAVEMAEDMRTALYETFAPEPLTMPLQATTYICRKT